MSGGRLFARGQRVRCIRKFNPEIWSARVTLPVYGQVYTIRDYGYPVGVWLVEIVNPVLRVAGGGMREPGFHQGHFAPVDGDGMKILREVLEKASQGEYIPGEPVAAG